MTDDRRARLEARERELGRDGEAIAFLNCLRARLGADSPHLADPDYEVTPKGRLVIHAAGLMYWRDERDGEPVAGRARGGRAEFAHVAEDGSLTWTLHPLGVGALN